MALALTTTSAAFFAASIGSFFYGLFFILAILSNGLHIQRILRNHENLSRAASMRYVLRNPMVIAGFAMFLIVSARWVLDVVDTAYGLLDSDDPQVYFMAPIRPRAVVGVVCGIGITHQVAVTPLGDSTFENALRHWIVTDALSNLLTNVYSTALIAYRIHLINSNPVIARLHGREDLKYPTESSRFLSGSAWIVFGMIAYAAKSPLDGFARTTLGTVSGISFMLINVRVALGWGQTRRSAPGSSINLTGPATPTAHSSVRVHMDTQVEMHVYMPQKGPGDIENG
ncbi:hypothetical protein K438DRAFT_1784908 [Mycena galopus ATCC 62051]|nr:hypothetical protein K438DRAFT_1784908 [Mycena galopus ATCC 62051]